MSFLSCKIWTLGFLSSYVLVNILIKSTIPGTDLTLGWSRRKGFSNLTYGHGKRPVGYCRLRKKVSDNGRDGFVSQRGKAPRRRGTAGGTTRVHPW